MSCDGHRWQSDGANIDHLFNGAAVGYTTVTGEMRVVGPPGAKTDDHDPRLADPHPSLAAHGVKRWARMDMDGGATLEAAVAAGVAYLAEQRQLSRAVYACVVCGHTQHERPAELCRP